MGKREHSNIVRIEKAVRANKQKFTTTLKDYARESIPGEWNAEIIEHPPTVPTGSEFELLQDILASSENVFYKPRGRKEYLVDSSHLKRWQLFAEHYTDYVGYITIISLFRHIQDVDILFDNKEIISND
ncbi:hypothetical protein VC838_05870 [Citrobacter freundii]|uniref:hypothetical protein n=1 Tax=Citrobacter sp. Cf042 TaxID=2985045 RepID=UPI00258225AD|nr:MULTISPECIES: hypothetical protein [Citrobacter]MDM3285470.1 hypothetical protein [Citrobacter sp. Cf042]MDN4261682.1 hypothetical protein [Citrobacter freundii]MEB0883996.1 hypothetical protein [Citrobacter freundii]HCB1586702.1 hypothetical protein [Citrobacter freundii]HEC5312783.1 hypothetical protein [Citrobacter freundii]